MKNTKYKILSLVIVIIILILLKNIILSKEIKVTMLAKFNKDMDINLLYTENKNEKITDDKSIKNQINGSINSNSFKKITFKIKSENINSLQMNLDPNFGEIVLQEIEVKGKNKKMITYKNIDKFETSNIEVSKINGNILLKSKGDNPIITLASKNEQNHAIYQLNDNLVLVSMFIILYFTVYRLLMYLQSIKSDSEWSEMIYIVLVLLILILPSINIDNFDIDEVENRRLADKPRLMINGEPNLNFGKDAESWFNDHFFKRKKILKLKNQIDLKIKNENDKVLLGENEWLFYRPDNSIENFQNKKIYTEFELERTKKIYLERKKWLDSLGIKYYIFIAPDKNKIYGEFYPKKIKKISNIDKIDQIKEYVNKDNINFIYPISELIESKNRGLLYWKDDTHWNDQGAFVGTSALLYAINKDFPQVKLLNEQDYNKELSYTSKNNDLSKILGLDNGKYKTIKYNKYTKKTGYSFKVVKINEKTLNLEDDENTQNVDIHPNTTTDLFKLFLKPYIKTKSNKPLKVFIIRDSFGTGMGQYLSETFGEVHYFRTKYFNELREIILKEKPDIVIQESVGRYIYKVESTETRLKEVK